MEQVRLAEDADARRHVRADESISGVARGPHMWNHLEGPPGRQQSLRELAQESAFSNNFYKWIRSFRLTEGRGDGPWGVSHSPSYGGLPQGLLPRALGPPGAPRADHTPGIRVFALLTRFQRLMAMGRSRHLGHSGLTRHAFLLSTPILDSRARSGMPHTIKKCPARRDLEVGA